MQKLSQLTEGEYFLGKMPVKPELVYGPIMYTYNFTNDPSEIPIDSLVQKVRAETGVDLEKVANSYHSGGISVAEQNGKKTRHEIIMFFMSRPKPQN